MLLGTCDKIVGQQGQVETLSPNKKYEVEQALKVASGMAYRNLLFCYREMSLSEFKEIENQPEMIEEKLTILAFFSLFDPLKP